MFADSCTSDLGLAGGNVAEVSWLKSSQYAPDEATLAKFGAGGFCITPNAPQGQAWLEIQLAHGAVITAIKIRSNPVLNSCFSYCFYD